MPTSTERKRIIFIISLILSLACVAFIFSNSLKDGVRSNEQSSSVYDLVNTVTGAIGFKSEIPHSLIRNLAHLAEFFLLGVFSALSFLHAFKERPATILKKLFPALVLCVAIAIIDELIQFGSDGRAPQISDALLDVSGAVCGIFAVWLVTELIISRKKRKDLTKNN